MLNVQTHPAVVAELRRAWRDSHPDDPANRHEEGGYILLHTDLTYSVERWPRGAQAGIKPPRLDALNRYDGKPVVVAFHTHPNPPVDEVGREWEQGPGTADRRWHARRGLDGLVISRAIVYAIRANGDIYTVGPHDKVLSP